LFWGKLASKKKYNFPEAVVQKRPHVGALIDSLSLALSQQPASTDDHGKETS
jgi:hypothetical protein